jgi:hypothetical protein
MNKKLIIALGGLFLLLIIFTGLLTYYREKEAQVQQTFNEDKDWFAIPLDYPSNYKELSSFIKTSKNVVLLNKEELKDAEGIRAVGSYMVEKSFMFDFDIVQDYLNDKDKYIFYNPDFITLSVPLESISVLKTDKYFGISLNTQDVIKKYNDSLLMEEDMLYFCSISEPALTDPLFEEIESESDFWFSQGSVSCMKIESNSIEDHAMVFVGFIPQAESIDIKLYFVDEQAMSDVISKQSFLEMKEIIENYPILWHMEKPINL